MSQDSMRRDIQSDRCRGPLLLATVLGSVGLDQAMRSKFMTFPPVSRVHCPALAALFLPPPLEIGPLLL